MCTITSPSDGRSRTASADGPGMAVRAGAAARRRGAGRDERDPAALAVAERHIGWGRPGHALDGLLDGGALGAGVAAGGRLSQSVPASGSMCVCTLPHPGRDQRRRSASKPHQRETPCASGERQLARQLHVQRQLVAVGQLHHAHVVDLAHLGSAQRRGGGALAQVPGRLGRLDVDDDVGPGSDSSTTRATSSAIACACVTPASDGTVTTRSAK